MAIRNTNTKKVDLKRSINSAIQTGNLPDGATVSKFPIHKADVSLGNPNVIGGPTAYPQYPLNTLTEGYIVGLTGDFRDRILTGSFFTIGRGNIRKTYSVKSNIYEPLSDQTTLSLFTSRENISPLDEFIGSTGYPVPSADSFLILNSTLEASKPSPSLLVNFSHKLYLTLTDTFSLEATWETVPSVKATRLRWRSVPRMRNVSNLSFSVTTPGYYTEIPSASIVSTTGRSAQIQLSGEVFGVNLGAGGTGYTTASAYAFGGNGTGASFSVGLSGSSVDTITVISGGTYTSAPNVVITGDGAGATVSSLVMLINGVQTLQQGGNYLSAPSVVVDTNYLVSTEVEVQSSLSLDNGGRVDYIRILDGGSGYTGASVSISGGTVNANAIASIIDGKISDIKVVYEGIGYTAASVTITPTGTGGTGASAYANVDLYSEWHYENPLYLEKTKLISGLKTNVPYEIQILVSEDERFRGSIKYSDSFYFQYFKS